MLRSTSLVVSEGRLNGGTAAPGNGWSLRSVQLKLLKIGGRLVRHARRLVFQLAEVAVPREVFAALLERIGRLALAPG